MPENQTRTIRYGEGITTGSVVSLLPMNTIFDYDIGLMRLINAEYNDPSIFDSKRLSECCEFVPLLVRELYLRKNPNPISLFMKDPDDTKTASDLYNEFFSKKFADITSACVHTGLYDLFTMLNMAEDIKLIIVYDGQEEFDLIEADPILKATNHIDYMDLDNVIKSCNQFFVRSVYDQWFKFLPKLVYNKVIYLLNYEYNFDENGAPVETDTTNDLLYELRCHFSYIDAYDLNRLNDIISKRANVDERYI